MSLSVFHHRCVKACFLGYSVISVIVDIPVHNVMGGFELSIGFCELNVSLMWL